MNKHTVQVLDHGFVTLRNLAGPTRRTGFSLQDVIEHTPMRDFDADDTDVANSARMSFEGQDRERSYEIEMKLNRYLLTNQHMTPFEAIEVWLEMKLPIFVARQLVRHRTVSLNEVSGRYVQLPAEWYIPALKDVVIQSADKKQGGRPVDLNSPEEVSAAEEYRRSLQQYCTGGYAMYEMAISSGIAMEQARLFLHLNHYTHWLWKQDLRNLMHMLALRDHRHAQPEAQVYARAIVQLLEPQLPGLMGLYNDLVKK